MDRPHIAIVDSNTLAVLGLKQLLQNVLPIMAVDTFGSIAELQAGQPDRYVHYFVAMDIVLSERAYFTERQRKTIVLTPSRSASASLSGFHSICTNQPEPMLIHQLLMLQQHAHAGGRNMPPMPQILQQNVLTAREIEVMVLIVQGYINKEIADRLSIALSTVITHRKNIMEKLGVKSVSALTIYAVMHGYIDINTI